MADRLPAEWERQAGTLLVWPHAETDWRSDLAQAERDFTALAVAIAQRQTLLTVCRSRRCAATVRQRLLRGGAARSRLCFAVAPSNDTWARDTAPLTVLTAAGGARLLDFRFNGWGGKYAADHDDALGARLHAAGAFGAVPLLRSERVVEGGAIDSDGAGTLLAVRRTLVDPRRNGGHSEASLSDEIKALTGARRLLLLDADMLSGDDTDGHIDTLVRFADRHTLVHVTAPRRDPDHAGLVRMARELAALRDRDGRRYRLVPLPHPGDVRDEDGRRLPASYANYQLINDALLIPVYDSPGDAAAMRILAALHPGRVPVPIDARHIVTQKGGLHCLCMQFPLGIQLTSAL